MNGEETVHRTVSTDWHYD